LIVIAVEFESSACALRRNQREEVIDAVWGRNGWGVGDFCNVWEETVETLKNLGGGVGGDVKQFANGLVDGEVGEVVVDSETMESIPTGRRHGNDKVWGSPCTWAEKTKTMPTHRPS